MQTNYNRLFLKEIFKYRKNTFFIIILSIISVASFTSIPFIIGLAVNEASNNIIDFNQIYFYISLILLFALISTVLNYFIMKISTTTSFNVVVDMRLKLFKKLHTCSISHFDTLHKGKVNSLLINDLQLVTDGLSSILRLLLPSFLTIIFSVIMMILLNSLIAIMIIVISISSLLFTRFLSQKSYKSIERALKLAGKYNRYTTHMINNSNIITNFNYQNISISEANVLNEELSRARSKAMFFSSLNGPASRFINNLTYLLVGLIGGLLFIYYPETITLAIITSLLFYANTFSRPLSELAQQQTQIVSCMVASARIFKFLEVNDDIDVSNKDIVINDTCVKFKNVSFSYNKLESLIEDFNIEVRNGQKVAIVGPTGSGKTTLVNLLMRFYELDKGSILIDDKDISHYSKTSLRKHIGMVLQESWIKEGSIKENLMYGNNELSFEQIVNICKSLKIDNFINHLPDGYDTVISDNSYSISQGQKQLINIARTMTTNSKILILDEATSNIDTRTEILIKQALDTLMKGKTTFIIAHRLKTIMNADIIIVLDKGNIVEVGNHNELLNKKSFYFELFNSQFKED